MPDELVQDRTMSGTGVLRIVNPPNNVRRYTVFVDLIRESLPDYRSKKYNPLRQRWATMVLLRDGYVVAEEPIDYEKRRFDYVLDVAGQNLIAIKCQYKGVLQSFANLGTALGLTVVSVVDTIKDYKSLNLLWDEARFVCEGSAALQVRLYRSKYEFCDDDAMDEDKPPVPPPPLPKVPSSTPIADLSRPYSNDNVTSPAPGDTIALPPTAFPIGNDCQGKYIVRVFRQEISGTGNPIGQPGFASAGIQSWGKITNVEVLQTSASSYLLRVTGRGNWSAGACGSPGTVVTYSGGGQYLGKYRVTDSVTGQVIYEGDGTIPDP